MAEIASNKEWKKWGETDPLFGVATWENRQRNGSNPWTDEDFYRLGELDWNDFLKHWEMYGVNKDSCLEIGCGAGRITTQLALHFKKVHAIDVSDKMIEYAKKHISSSSVDFHVSNGMDIPLADQSVYSVFSAHVFQHFDSFSIADRYIAEIARTMKAGGTFMIHLPLYKFPSNSFFYKLIHATQKALADIRTKAIRLLMDYGIANPPMRMLIYPIEYFYDVLPKYGFKDIELVIFSTTSNHTPHSFIFARKNS